MLRSLLVASLVNLVASQAVTVNAISQIGDGQIQAPTGPQPPASAPPAPSVASEPPSPEPPIATDSTPYSNPVTSYATGSESWVVVTSVPTVPTAQSQPPAPPASQAVVTPSTSYHNTSTVLQPSSEPVTETTVVVTSSRLPSSPSIASVSGADMNRVTGAGIALLVVSIGFFML